MPAMRPGVVKPIHLNLEHAVDVLPKGRLTDQAYRSLGVQTAMVWTGKHYGPTCRVLISVVSDDAYHRGLRTQSTKKSSFTVPSEISTPDISSRID